MNIGPVIKQDLRALLDDKGEELMTNLNCVQIGMVEAVDLSKQSVKVKLVIKRAVFNNPPTGTQVNPRPNLVDYPVLVDVPMFVPFGGAACLTMPVSPGDTCIVLFNDRDLDPWWSTGSTASPPNSARTHSLADGLAIVGVRAKTNPIGNFNSSRTQLRNGPSMVSVGDKLKLSNADQNLKDVLDNLCAVLTNWRDTHGDVPDSGTLAAIANFKASVDQLFE